MMKKFQFGAALKMLFESDVDETNEEMEISALNMRLRHYCRNPMHSRWLSVVSQSTTSVFQRSHDDIYR